MVHINWNPSVGSIAEGVPGKPGKNWSTRKVNLHPVIFKVGKAELSKEVFSETQKD